MASTTIGELSVKITADAKGVEEGVKDANKALRESGKQLRASVNQFAKWGIAGAAAAAAIAAAIVKSNLTSIKELKSLAFVANETVASFQQGAFAAEKFNVPMDKFSDILKDVNDRIGDFVTAGSGPMVDFFEQIGPKVGITAEAFKGLSGSESLALYVKSLEEANLNQQEMTFFMEAIAGDATLLIPLFTDNAKAMKAMAKEAKELGIGLSDVDVEKATLANEQLARVSAINQVAINQLTVELAPIIAKVAELFVDMAKEAGGASELIHNGINQVVEVIGVFADGVRGIQVIFKGLEVAVSAVNVFIAGTFEVIARLGKLIVQSVILPIKQLIELGAKLPGAVGDGFQGALDGVNNFNEGLDNGVENISEFTNAMIAGTKKAADEFNALATAELPSVQIKNFVAESIEEFDKLAQARVDANQKVKDAESTEFAGAKKSSEIAVFQAETIGILEALGLRFQSQEEMELANLERRRAMIQADFDAGRITAKEQSDALVAIKQSEEDTKRQITLNSVQAGFQALASNSKKVQKAMTIAAKIQAAIKGKQAAVDAWQAGMSVGGPFAPVFAAAYAGASLVNTARMIQGIGSGGSSSGSAGGGGSVPTPSTGGVTGGGTTQQAPQAQRNISINLTGQSLFSSDQVRELITQINEATGDGVQLNFTGA